MLNTKKLTQFLLKARTQTYVGNAGKVEPLLQGSNQLEFTEGEWFYRDIYNQGNSKFIGLETVYYRDKPVWSMSYYGNFEHISEEEVDKILRKALLEKSDKVRLWNTVQHEMGEYVYMNDASGSIEEMEGSEIVERNNETVFFFYYAGGTISR